MKNLVLVPTDFSEVCDNAIHHAAQAAKFLNYKIMLLHVIDKNTREYLKKEDKGEAHIQTKLQEKADEIKARESLEVETKSVPGDIFTTIGEVAQNEGANLVFLGTHGKEGMQKLTGSYALKVITSSPSPVIVVQKRAFEKGFKEIVLPITNEAGPWEKTKWAVFMAKEFDATIHVYQIGGASKAVQDAAQRIASYLEKNSVQHTLEIAGKDENFTKQVIDYSTAHSADMIMIMTNPDSTFKRFLLGSYDEDIIFNASQIPVMCINPRKLNYEILGM
ncbi:MAG: universal stress protein [Bacteroidales bacterium]|nr:universal stress protein [Bacteroidales bacterium]MCF8336471.1 universal stress protein [Bacteroidales bacterium]